MVSLVRLMLFTTTVEILTVRTGSVQSCHQTPIFPYRGRARQTRFALDTKTSGAAKVYWRRLNSKRSLPMLKWVSESEYFER